MKDKKLRAVIQVNESFRAWTRGTSFTLQMGKTQVATLVAIAMSVRREYVGLGHPMLRCWVPAIRGLEDRGLVCRPAGWTEESCKKNLHKRESLSAHQVPTDAGWLVIDLLKCAGVYEEIRREMLLFKFDEYGNYSRAQGGY